MCAIRELYIAETIDAQMVLIGFNIIRAKITDIDAFIDHKIYDLLEGLNKKHVSDCKKGAIFLEIYIDDYEIHISAIRCKCECFAGVDFARAWEKHDHTIEMVREILLVIYNHSFTIKLVKDSIYNYQIFGKTY